MIYMRGKGTANSSDAGLRVKLKCLRIYVNKSSQLYVMLEIRVTNHVYAVT